MAFRNGAIANSSSPFCSLSDPILFKIPDEMYLRYRERTDFMWDRRHSRLKESDSVMRAELMSLPFGSSGIIAGMTLIWVIKQKPLLRKAGKSRAIYFLAPA